MYLIVGLGNPGKKYENTRHNIGFIALDYFAHREGFFFSESKWEAQVAKERFGTNQAVFAKPQTYMNNSGRAVGKISSYYKIPPEKVIIIQDDLDIELGRIKLVENRGAGGHNGIISIIQHLGSKKISRIRLGIGRPESGSGMPVDRFVLAKFRTSEQPLVNELLSSVSNCIDLIIKQGVVEAMNQINRR